jgi:copper oxidase (laccase) domain-containing protein
VVIVGERSIANLHCGWRGAVNGIISRAAKLFQAEGESPQYAYVGAGISCESFEVKNDFISEVSAIIDSAQYLTKHSGSWHFDLKKYILDSLADIGVTKVESSKMCTVVEPSLHSYRRDGAQAGRMLTVAYKIKNEIY